MAPREDRVSPLRGTLGLTVLGLVAGSWVVTWATAEDLMGLLLDEIGGRSPAAFLWFLALAGAMIVAMMLPSALPMLAAFRGLVARETSSPETGLRTVLFGGGYLVAWTLFTVASLIVLAGMGWARGMTDASVGAGILLVAAGAYQFTAWKRLCLSHCRSPAAFVLAHWRPGRAGALGMGLRHAVYCVGCCWLLMLVLFVAGAMSLLWMGVLAVLILGEKVWRQGEALAKAVGVAAAVAGVGVLLL